MKLSLLSSIALGFLLASSSADAAPRKRVVGGSTAASVLPDLIPGRTAPPTNVPAVSLDAEKNALSRNGPLPEGVETKGGFALDLTNVTVPSNIALSRVSLPLASTAKIASLKTQFSLADSAYCDTVIAGKWTCSTCLPSYTLIKTFSVGSHDATGYIARNDKTKEIELVYRGSASIDNWIANLEFIRKDYPPVAGASVHIGFYDSYIQSQSIVLTTVRAQLTSYPSYRIVVTGHSLGGAIAPFAALDLYQRDSRISNENIFIYTYGGPRIGNDEFAYYLTSTGITYERTVNNRDIVVHLPPQSFGYLHAGVEYWITSDTSVVKICGTSLDSDDCSNSIVPFTSVSDHTSYFDLSRTC
ncbi:lipase [Phycomyces nitens]|nr:lipase [Phycomyces nitens]